MVTKYVGLLATSAMLLMCTTTAQAAARSAHSGPPAAADQPQAGNGELIVTAQKRAQSINSVGMTITAVTGANLIARGVSTTADLNKVVAGLSIVPNGTGQDGTPIYTLRGIGFNEKSISALSAVSFSDDDLPLPYVYMTAGPSLDLQRVEVLKGPQGTLYGQNSTGGAINFFSNKPTNTPAAGAEIGYGSYNAFDVSGYVSGPLTDRLKARVAFRSITGEGWQNSISRPGDTHGSKDSQAGRVIIDWTPTDKVRFELNLNGWIDHSESQAAQLIGTDAAVPSFFISPASYPFFDAIFGHTIVPPSSPRAADWTPGLDYRNHNEFGQVGLRADWDLTPDITFTSITAASYFKLGTFTSVSGSPVLTMNYGDNGSINSYSEEVRFTGRSFDSRLHWIVGANFSHDVIDEFQSSPDPENTFFYIFGNLFFGKPISQTHPFNNETRATQAGFASADFELTPKITLTGGVRYTADQFSMAGCTLDGGDGEAAGILTGGAAGPGQCVTALDQTAPGSFGVVHKSLSESNVAWRFGVNYRPVQGTLLYATISRGFKGGNFPTLSAVAENAYVPVVQEQVTTYEGGIKTRPFGDILQLNAAIYHSDYVNKQLYVFVNNPVFGTEETTLNVPTSVVDGAEFEATLHPLAGLMLEANLNYTRSKITQGPPCPAPFTAPTCVYSGLSFASFPYGQTTGLLNLTGQPFNLSPQWQANFNADYRWSLTETLEGFVGASVLYQSAETPTIGASTGQTVNSAGQTVPTGTPGGFVTVNQTIPAYTTLDLRAGVESKSGNWRLTIWGRNVTNTLYVVEVSRGFDTTARYTGMPATFGATFGFNFR